MRIIAGTKARMTLLPPRDKTTRPITDRVKESLFSILAEHLDQACVADLFCGTGSLGLEALSRGAARAIMVDSDLDALKRLRENITRLNFEKQTSVFRLNAFKSGIPDKVKNKIIDSCSLVFVDPPYALSRETTPESDLGRLMIKLGSQVAPQAIIVVRHEKKVKMPLTCQQAGIDADPVQILQVYDRRDYGSMAITFYQAES